MNTVQKYFGGISGLCIALCSTVLSLAAAQSTAPGMAANGSEARGTSTPNYFLASQVDWIPLLPAPPKAGSPEQQRDLQSVLDMQASTRKNAARRQQAIEDSEGSCFHFNDVLGAAFDEKQLPRTAEFLNKAVGDGGSAASSVKSYWKRPRPYITSDKVEKLADMDPEYVKKKAEERKAREEQEKKDKAAKDLAEGKVVAEARPAPPANNKPANTKTDPEADKKKAEEAQNEKDNTSYPSGHATIGTLCGIFLTQMVPEKQTELFARAETYRESRLIVGAHHRTDIDAGKLLGTAVAAVMSQNYAFQRDEAAARVELRAALGLPAELPERKTDKKAEKK